MSVGSLSRRWIIVFFTLQMLATGCGADNPGDPCQPRCEGRCCGDDGCGGTCSSACPSSATCNTTTCACESECTPMSCQAAGAACGTVADGCGGTLNCGICTTVGDDDGGLDNDGGSTHDGGLDNDGGSTHDGGVDPDQSCTPQCADRCTGADGCGGQCPNICKAPNTCGGGTVADACGCTGNCTPVRVFILSGQSNMEGRGDLRGITDGITYYPSKDVYFYWQKNGKLTELMPAGLVSAWFGPELSMAHELRKIYPGERIALIKFAEGGTHLHGHWFPGANASSPTGSRYRTLLKTVRAGMQALRDKNVGFPLLQGFAWMQGEQDGYQIEPASAYYANLTRFIRRVREDLDAPQLPFAIGRIQAVHTVAHRLTVRAAQDLATEAVNNTVLVNTDDLSLTDPIHFDAAGNLTLGRRFARALTSLEQQPADAPLGPLGFLPLRAPESLSYRLAYELPICEQCNYKTRADVAKDYRQNASAALADVAFDRVAYLMVLQDASHGLRFAWASMDAFTKALADTSVPTDITVQRWAGKMTVASDHPYVTPAFGSRDGNVEFWNNSYRGTRALGHPGGSDTQYDCDDTIRPTSPDKYGSMQVHNNGQTVFSFSGWGADGSGRSPSLGLGSRRTGAPDWTFAENWGDYTHRRLYVFVQPSVVDAAPEAKDYTRIYSLDVPTYAEWDTPSDVPYNMDRSVELSSKAFDRVAYYVELAGPTGGTRWIWTSMDAFTSRLSRIGVPVDSSFDQTVDNLTVRSNHPAIAPATLASGGRMEFWSNCYNRGPNGVYDYDDDIRETDCYGSMQVHRDDETLWAFNAWSYDELRDVGTASYGYKLNDIGIGSQPSNHPDWTHAGNAGKYVIRKIQVFARFK